MGVPIVVPITPGGAFARSVGFSVSLSGTRTTGIIRCGQPRPIDLVARAGRRVEDVPAAILEDVLARLTTLFQ